MVADTEVSEQEVKQPVGWSQTKGSQEAGGKNQLGRHHEQGSETEMEEGEKSDPRSNPSDIRGMEDSSVLG